MRPRPDRAFVLTGWWLFAAYAGLAANPQMATAQLVPVPEYELLDTHPACEAGRAAAMRLRFRDRAVTIYHPDIMEQPAVTRLRVRRGSSVQPTDVFTQGERVLDEWAEHSDARLDAEIVLCVSPVEMTVAAAEWSLVSDTNVGTLTSTQQSASAKLALSSYLYSEGLAEALFALEDSEAVLVQGGSRLERTVTIGAHFWFESGDTETTQ